MGPRERLLAWAKAAGAAETDAEQAIKEMLDEEREACAMTIERTGLSFLGTAGGVERKLGYTMLGIVAESAFEVRERGGGWALRPPSKAKLAAAASGVEMRLTLLEGRVGTLEAAIDGAAQDGGPTR